MTVQIIQWTRSDSSSEIVVGPYGTPCRTKRVVTFLPLCPELLETFDLSALRDGEKKKRAPFVDLLEPGEVDVRTPFEEFIMSVTPKRSLAPPEDVTIDSTILRSLSTDPDVRGGGK